MSLWLELRWRCRCCDERINALLQLLELDEAGALRDRVLLRDEDEDGGRLADLLLAVADGGERREVLGLRDHLDGELRGRREG